MPRTPSPLVASLALGLLTLALYVVTLYPSVPGGDSGELIVAAQTVSSAHPTGYPLYVLLAKGFTWLPFKTVAWRVNAFSAVCGAGAAFFLALTVGGLTRQPWAGVAAGGLFAFSPTVWRYATSAEVFPLNNLVVALQVYLAARAWSEGDRRFGYATAFTVGLGCANHVTSTVVGVVMLGGLVWHSRELRRARVLAGLAAAVLAGLLPYLWLPIASAAAVPSAAQWGDQTTVTGFLDHVLRREYGTLRLGGAGFDGRIDTLSQLAYYGSDAVRQVAYLGALLAAWGLYRSVQDRRLRAGVAVSVLAWVVFLVAFHSFANLPIDQPLFHGVVARFWQMPLLFVCGWAGLGLAALNPRGQTEVRRRSDSGPAPRLPPNRWLAVAALTCVGGQAALNVRAADHRDEWTIHDYGLSVLGPLPDRALVLTRGDLVLNSARYLQSVEHVQVELRILDQEMLTFRWMKGLVARRMPDIAIPGAYYHVREPGAYNLRQLVDANITRRPVVVCGGVKEGDSSLDAAYDQWPLGLCSELRPKAAAVDMEDWLRRSEAALPIFRPGTSAEPPADSWERIAWNDFWEARHRRGFWLLTQAIAHADRGPLLAQAAAIFDDLIQRSPSPPPYYFKNSGIAYGRLAGIQAGAGRKAIDTWEKYLSVAPLDDKDLPAIRQAIVDLQRAP